MQYTQYIQSIIHLLQYHQNSGIVYYPYTQGLEHIVEETRRTVVPGKNLMSRNFNEDFHMQINSSKTDNQASAEVHTTLANIAEEVSECRACNLSNLRLASRAGGGSCIGVRLMLVGDWLRQGADSELSESVQFGVEEDCMIARMLEAIHLPIDKVFITNVIKCVIPNACQPAFDNISACKTYLYRQIELLNPELICTMGLVAARALLGGTQPLSRLRGRMYAYTINEKRQVPVIATYHPAFLLKNPEMKKAAWMDLQKVGSLLGVLPK